MVTRKDIVELMKQRAAATGKEWLRLDRLIAKKQAQLTRRK